MIYVSFLYSIYSMIFLFVGKVEGPLSKSLTSLKLGVDDPCADERAPGKTPRSNIWYSIHRSGEQRSYSFEVIHATANKFFREFEYEHALRCYNKAVDKNVRRYAKVYRNRGLCFSRLRLHNPAILDYVKSLELEPESVRGRYFLGRQYLEVGRVDESKTELKKALEYGEEQNMIHDEKVQINLMINRIKQKKKEMEQEQEKIRHERLFGYLKDLIFEDAKKKIFQIKVNREENADEKIEKVVKNLDEYLDELKVAFFAPDNKILQPASKHLAPKYLCDVISLEIMRYPVVTPSGISYENSQIRLSLETDPRDPTSRDRISVRQLRPNKALKRMIRDYMKKNGLFYDESSQDLH